MKHPLRSAADLDRVQFGSDGLVPVVAQDETTGAVLMLAWADRDALAASLDTGRMTYFSRSRGVPWQKGETSGHTQRLVALAVDCDLDAVLAVVDQHGPACHEGTGTCWTKGEAPPVATWLGAIDRLAADRAAQPEGRYTDRLLADPTFVAAKIEEEAAEVAAVLRGEPNEDPLAHEAADLLYHVVVAVRGADSSLASVLRELHGRA